nr:unnamed protein product [Digitaria exilis]
MAPSVTCAVKCRPHPRLVPQPPAASLELLAAPAAAELRASSTRCRNPPSLSLSRSAEPAEPRAPCRGSPSARRARVAVASASSAGDDGDGGAPALILAGALSRYAISRDDLVRRAFAVAKAAHRGQVRANGDPYLKHCVETAALLAELGAGPAVVAAGLLHDTVDDAGLDYCFISDQFGAGVADLVKGVSNLSHFSKLARRNDTASRMDEADRLRTVFLAKEDARAVLIKLADRLHNMRTLDSLPNTKQQCFAKETLEIFAPLANQLGILNWKEQLENLCFKYLYTDKFDELSTNLLEFYNRDMIAAAKRRLEQALEVRGLSYYAVYGRHKSIYSIHSKMASGPVLVILLENEKMSVQEFAQNSTVWDLLKRSSNYGMPLRLRLNCQAVHSWSQELKMGDVLELIPSTPCKSRSYTKEFHEMFDHRLAVSQP